MDYKTAIDYINGIVPDSDREISTREVEKLSALAGNPENSLRIIHIAGTNGKGSVGNYITNILAMSGYTVGRYVSPTLFEYRERVQRITGDIYGVRQELISEDEVAEILTHLKKLADKMSEEGENYPSAFEIETVMAFEAMKRWKVDVAVVETGMGGRNDATNIIEKPILSVITSISMDHMQFLGDTLPEIAMEKYGIIKNNVPVVSLMQDESCMEELKTVCYSKNAPLTIVKKEDIRPFEFQIHQTSFTYKDEKYALSQAGVYQFENASIAIEAVHVLFERGLRMLNKRAVKEALFSSRWTGRFELVSREPFVLVDGAHNPAAARVLKYSLNAYFPNEKFNYIIGVFKDKDYKQILEITLPHAKNVYTITASGERGLDKDILAKIVEEIAAKNKLVKNIKEIQSFESVESALKKSCFSEMVGKTIVFGSLSFLHEVYQYFGSK